MKYADFVKKEFGEEYVFEVGDLVVTTKDMCFMSKGTVAKIIDVSARGYDLMDEYGNKVIEAGWNNVRKY